MAPTVLVHHGTSLFGAIAVRWGHEIVILALTDHIANAAFVICDCEFGIQKVWSGDAAKL